MRRLLLAVFVIALALSSAVPGSAHLRGHHDPNDAKVDDLSSVRLRTYRNPDGVKMLSATAVFYPDVSPEDCCWSISFVIDSRGDGDADYVLSVASDGASGGIYATSLTGPDGATVDVRIGVTRDCGGCYSHLPVKLKYGALHPTRHIRWYVTTAGDDRAPNWGWYEH